MARPKSFDPEEALVNIKRSFWRNGYEGTSIQDIEVATGQKKQSLYRAFGSKREMYLKALAHYAENEIESDAELLRKDGMGQERLSRPFEKAVETAVAGGDRDGCFMCNSILDQAQHDSATKQALNKMMQNTHSEFVAALSASAPYSSDEERCSKKAAELLATYFGLRVLVRADASEETLRNVVRSAISSIKAGDLQK